MKKIVKVLFMLIGAIVCMSLGSLLTSKKNKVSGKNRSKFKAYYDTANQWLMLKNEGKSLDEYFIRNGYKTIAIYGMGEMGNRLYEELKNSKNIEVKYAIDENSDYLYSEKLNVILPSDDFESVDVIVITPLFDFNSIHEKLIENTDCSIISLEDVVFEI